VDLGPAPGARWQFAGDRDEPVRRFIGKPFVQLDSDDITGTDTVVPLQSSFRVITRGGLGNTAGAIQEAYEICAETAIIETSCEDPAAGICFRVRMRVSVID